MSRDKPTPHNEDTPGQRQRVPVVWGCSIHHTPAGTECHHCADQHELFTRADIPPTTYHPRPH